MKTSETILLVEDEEFVRDSMADVLREEGYAIAEAASVREARLVLERTRVHLVLTDLRLPGEPGIELLRGAERDGASPPVVVITGHGTVDDAVDAMKAGAYDFLQKPIDPEQLALVVRRAIEHGRLVDEVLVLRNAVQRQQEGRPIVGSSRAMAQVRQMVERVAPADATVLVSGESGTGKELVAAEIHKQSPRAEGSLVLVNCAAVPATLFESEFFGHKKGAYSGAHADRSGRFAEAAGGTLVLDEVHTLGADVQAKLLRVLETGEYQMVGESRTRVVDVRIVAVTNANLDELVREGAFRTDLFYRLNVFPIEVPPLREHKEDIPEIVLELFARMRGRATGGAEEQGLDAEALAVLCGYAWPGNVRELRNILERALILAPSGRIDAGLLRELLGASTRAIPPERELNLRVRLEATERQIVQEALARTEGSKKLAAQLLGVDPKNLSYYLRKHGLKSEDA